MAVLPKYWWKSSTIWINLAGMVALILDYFVRSGSIQDAEWIALILAVVNILRRFQAPKVIQPLKIV